MDIAVRPIGVIRSSYRTVLDAPRQGEFARGSAEVVLEPRFAEGLLGIEPGARLLILWWAHEADRALLSRADMGVFAGRAPHRPNPIAISEVEVVEVRGATLVVRGLEAIDGTPVLDVKSANAEYDGWTPLPGVAGLEW